MTLQDFGIGQCVVLARVKRDAYLGKAGTVQRVIKSRKVVRVLMNNAKDKYDTYDAYPENLDILTVEK